MGLAQARSFLISRFACAFAVLAQASRLGHAADVPGHAWPAALPARVLRRSCFASAFCGAGSGCTSRLSGCILQVLVKSMGVPPSCHGHALATLRVPLDFDCGQKQKAPSPVPGPGPRKGVGPGAGRGGGRRRPGDGLGPRPGSPTDRGPDPGQVIPEPCGSAWMGGVTPGQAEAEAGRRIARIAGPCPGPGLGQAIGYGRQGSLPGAGVQGGSPPGL